MADRVLMFNYAGSVTAALSICLRIIGDVCCAEFVVVIYRSCSYRKQLPRCRFAVEKHRHSTSSDMLQLIFMCLIPIAARTTATRSGNKRMKSKVLHARSFLKIKQQKTFQILLTAMACENCIEFNVIRMHSSMVSWHQLKLHHVGSNWSRREVSLKFRQFSENIFRKEHYPHAKSINVECLPIFLTTNENRKFVRGPFF